MRERWKMGRTAGALTLGLVLALGACSGKDDAKQAVREPALGWTEQAQSGALPIRLTGSDGHGMALVSVRAEAIVEAPLAFTELHLRFQNPEPRRREGRFEITLPPGAAVSRFAMRVGGLFQEGEVVERRAAQQAYEDFLHRRQDPALLEQVAANQFSARVFPIGPHEEKEIILSYSETLADAKAPYRLNLAGLPTMRELSVRVLAGGAELHLSKDDFAPRGDLTVTAGGHSPDVRARAVQSGDLMMARVTPELSSEAAPLDGLSIAFDTSASTALSFRDRVQRLGTLVDALRVEADADFPVQLIAFDQGSEELYVGSASGLSRDGLPALQKRMPLGATDLGRALDTLAGKVKQPRLLLVSDAVVTAGAELRADLDTRLRALGKRGVKRVDVLLVGGIHDNSLAERIAGGPFERAGVVMSEHRPQSELVAALTATVHARVPVQVEGASWWWPNHVRSLQPGQSTVVLARREGEGPAQVRVGKWETKTDPVTIHRALLEREWAQARIAELELEQDAMGDGDLAQRATLQAEATALSVRHRVLSRRTAFLVLETEADYARFDIPRAALSDILVVGEQGLQLLRGAQRADQLVAFGEPRAKEEAKRVAEDGESWDRRTRSRGRAEAAPPPVPAAQPAGSALQADEAEPAVAAAPVGPPARRPNPNARRVEESTAQAERLLLGALKGGEGLGNALQGGAVTGNAEDILGQSAGHSVGSNAGQLRTRSRPAESVIVERAIRGRVSVASSATGVAPTGSSMDPSVVQRMVRQRLRAIQMCYERQLRARPTLKGEVSVAFTIVTRGTVARSEITRNTTGEPEVGHCVDGVVRRFRFNPGPDRDSAFAFTFHFEPDGVATSPSGPVAAVPRPRPTPAQLAARRARRARQAEIEREWEGRPGPDLAAALEGKLLAVMVAADAGNTDTALLEAWRWRAEAPGDVLSLLGLGYALNAAGDGAQASRAYGSVIDLFAGRADLRRMAGNFLERVALTTDDADVARDALSLATDTYARAREQRPDHPASHRLHAFALVKAGDYEGAFAALREGYGRSYPEARFAGAKEILADDLRILASAWKAARPKEADAVDAALAELDLKADGKASLRFVLSWETDANDVDFHLYDGKKGHAYFGRPKLPSGGKLIADVTTGYGPECFRIDDPKTYPYEISAHYYSRGPMGYGMGKVQVVKHDGRGELTFDERPFVIMKDRAFVHLGTVDEDLGQKQVVTQQVRGG